MDERNSESMEGYSESQQWVYDWVIKQTGRTHVLEYDDRVLPPDVKTFAMIPRAMQRAGGHYEAVAAAAEAAGSRLTARDLYLKALNRYHVGQHAIFEDDNADKIFLYERLTHCFDRVLELSDGLVERVEIPWGDKHIQGVFHRAPGVGKAPTVLAIPGLDMIKEEFADPSRNYFTDRGMNLLVIDGPGQGISNLRKIRVTEDNFERAGSAAVTYLTGRPDVIPDRIGFAGVSMGTHWGLRLMAFDQRIIAGAAGVCATSRRSRDIFESGAPRHKRLFMYITGCKTEAEFRELSAKWNLAGVAEKIVNPLLMIAGEFDSTTPLKDTLDTFEHVAGPKELWVLEDDFHGGVREGVAGLGGLGQMQYLADWLRAAFDGRAPAGKVMRSIPKSSGVGPFGHEATDFSLASRQPS
ncbi:alpha/beta hydrolase [Amycolatopsis acidicola]|uniref:Alpha/beta hydrolase n=1 Tax=Amycolatopsis acidicola TaxID=2596893 RepID=A0A5N0V2U5_9PSEU|nr:alpha/beta hydrolase [Amycolatopsis acidicola]KAA9160696.1 alpha/beta hydrolase [Amycolatopsis acidicola]